MGIVSCPRLPQFVPIIPLPYFSILCPYLEFLQDISNEFLASYRYALAPLRLSRIAVTDNGFFNPIPMAFYKQRIGSKTTTGNQLFTI